MCKSLSYSWVRVAFCFLVAISSVITPVQAQGLQSELWTKNETLLTSTAIATALGLSLFDESVRRQFQEHRSNGWDNASDVITTAGHPLTALGLSAALWGIGHERNDAQLTETGLLAFRAVALSQAFTLTSKIIVGRSRPKVDSDAYTFDPFSLDDDDQSLPSAHTASAFALASILARRSDGDYAPFVYYGFATLVGVSRIEQDEHWLSDVVVGALIGELSARLIINWKLSKNSSIAITPSPNQGFVAKFGLVW